MYQFPLDQTRADTAGVAHSIFMNNAGASLRPAIVTQTTKDFLDLEDRGDGSDGITSSRPCGHSPECALLQYH